MSYPGERAIASARAKPTFVPRTVALDYGDARVGVAIDDELGSLAHPRGTLPAHPEPKLLAELAKLVKDSSVSRFVVGLPLDMKGGEGDAARKSRAFAQRLADATGLDVELWDERLTTAEARRASAVVRRSSQSSTSSPV